MRQQLSRFTSHAARFGRIRGRMQFGSLVLVVLVAALVAPLAQADKWGSSARANSSGVNLRPDDRGGTRGPAGSAVPAIGPHHYGVRPDDAVGPRGPSIPILTSTKTSPKVVTVRIGSFQWLDAGVGAAVAIAAMTAVGGAILLTSRRGSKPAVSG
jgi:hypothetical protein